MEVRIKKSVTILVGILVIAGMFLILIFLVNLVFPPNIAIRTPTPEMNIIPAPSATSAAENPAFTQTPDGAGAVEVNGVEVGVYVQVTGTGGTGLRLRSEPGSDAKTEAIATDDEVFKVIAGPTDKDGHIWWKLEAPYQSSRAGWAAADYLSPIITPTPN